MIGRVSERSGNIESLFNECDLATKLFVMGKCIFEGILIAHDAECERPLCFDEII